jgi:GFO/IDH/MocA oxidoreductase family protein
VRALCCVLVGAVLAGGAWTQQPLSSRPAAAPWATRDLRAGIIGTDTSHVPAFTAMFDAHPEWRIRVVAAFKGGSPDLPISVSRVNGFAQTIHDKYGVELVDSIDMLLSRVDVVLIESVDGRRHLAEVMPVLKAGKRVFVDKPLAASVGDARRILETARQDGTPIFSASSYRFHPDMPRLRADPGVGRVAKVQASSPLNLLAHHPDLYYYGIHGVEALYAFMGRGCISVSRKITPDADVTTGQWQDGRTGVYYGPLTAADKPPMIRIWGEGGTTESSPSEGYEGLESAIAEFFQTGRSPVDPAETLEVLEFMSAAQLSKDRGGAQVLLAETRR